jgi:hypothetical protein
MSIVWINRESRANILNSAFRARKAPSWLDLDRLLVTEVDLHKDSNLLFVLPSMSFRPLGTMMAESTGKILEGVFGEANSSPKLPTRIPP